MPGLARQPSQEQLRQDVGRMDEIICERATYELVELGVVSAVLGEEVRLLELGGPNHGQDAASLQDDMCQQVNALQSLNEVATQRSQHQPSHRSCTGRTGMRRPPQAPIGHCRGEQANVLRRHIRPPLRHLGERLLQQERDALSRQHCELQQLREKAQAEMGRAQDILRSSEEAVQVAQRNCAFKLEEAGVQIASLREQLSLEVCARERHVHDVKEKISHTNLRARKDRSNMRKVAALCLMFRHFSAWSQCVLRWSRFKLRRRASDLSETLRKRGALMFKSMCGLPFCDIFLYCWREHVWMKQRERQMAGLASLRERSAKAELRLKSTSGFLRRVHISVWKEVRALSLGCIIRSWNAVIKVGGASRRERKWRHHILVVDSFELRRRMLLRAIESWRAHTQLQSVHRRLESASDKFRCLRSRSVTWNGVAKRLAASRAELRDGEVQKTILLHWAALRAQQRQQRAVRVLCNSACERARVWVCRVGSYTASRHLQAVLLNWHASVGGRRARGRAAAFAASRCSSLEHEFEIECMCCVFSSWSVAAAHSHARTAQTRSRSHAQARLREHISRMLQLSSDRCAALVLNLWHMWAMNSAKKQRWTKATADSRRQAAYTQMLLLFTAWRLRKEALHTRVQKMYASYVTLATGQVHKLCVDMSLCRAFCLWRTLSLSCRASRQEAAQERALRDVGLRHRDCRHRMLLLCTRAASDDMDYFLCQVVLQAWSLSIQRRCCSTLRDELSSIQHHVVECDGDHRRRENEIGWHLRQRRMANHTIDKRTQHSTTVVALHSWYRVMCEGHLTREFQTAMSSFIRLASDDRTRAPSVERMTGKTFRHWSEVQRELKRMTDDCEQAILSCRRSSAAHAQNAQDHCSQVLGNVLRACERSKTLLYFMGWRLVSANAKATQEATRTMESKIRSLQHCFDQSHEKQARVGVVVHEQSFLRLVFLLWQHDVSFVRKLRTLWPQERCEKLRAELRRTPAETPTSPDHQRECTRLVSDIASWQSTLRQRTGQSLASRGAALENLTQRAVFHMWHCSVRAQRQVLYFVSSATKRSSRMLRAMGPLAFRLWCIVAKRRRDELRRELHTQQGLAMAEELHVSFESRSQFYVQAARFAIDRQARLRAGFLLRASFSALHALVRWRQLSRPVLEKRILAEISTLSGLIVAEWRRHIVSQRRLQDQSALHDEIGKRREFAEHVLAPVIARAASQAAAASASIAICEWKAYALSQRRLQDQSRVRDEVASRSEFAENCLSPVITRVASQVDAAHVRIIVSEWKRIALRVRPPVDHDTTKIDVTQLAERMLAPAVGRTSEMYVAAYVYIAISEWKHQILCKRSAQDHTRLRQQVDARCDFAQRLLACVFSRVGSLIVAAHALAAWQRWAGIALACREGFTATLHTQKFVELRTKLVSCFVDRLPTWLQAQWLWLLFEVWRQHQARWATERMLQETSPELERLRKQLEDETGLRQQVGLHLEQLVQNVEEQDERAVQRRLSDVKCAVALGLRHERHTATRAHFWLWQALASQRAEHAKDAQAVQRRLSDVRCALVVGFRHERCAVSRAYFWLWQALVLWRAQAVQRRLSDVRCALVVGFRHERCAVSRAYFWLWQALVLWRAEHAKEKERICAEAARELEALRLAKAQEASLQQQSTTSELESIRQRADADLERSLARCLDVGLRATTLRCSSMERRSLAMHVCVWRIAVAERRHERGMERHRSAVRGAVAAGVLRNNMTVLGMHFYLWRDAFSAGNRNRPESVDVSMPPDACSNVVDAAVLTDSSLLQGQRTTSSSSQTSFRAVWDWNGIVSAFSVAANLGDSMQSVVCLSRLRAAHEFQEERIFKRISSVLIHGHFMVVARAFALWQVWTVIWLRPLQGEHSGRSARSVRTCSSQPSLHSTSFGGDSVPELPWSRTVPQIEQVRWQPPPYKSVGITMEQGSQFTPPDTPSTTANVSDIRHSDPYLSSRSFSYQRSPASFEESSIAIKPQDISCAEPRAAQSLRHPELQPPSRSNYVGHRRSACLQEGASAGLGTEEAARLHAEASMLRVECGALSERHWQLCYEIDSVVSEMRGHLRASARASGDQKLSLEQAMRVGRWFLDVIHRLGSLTTFMESSTLSHSRVSMARVCSPPGPRRGG